jgi:hypothetical protein
MDRIVHLLFQTSGILFTVHSSMFTPLMSTVTLVATLACRAQCPARPAYIIDTIRSLHSLLSGRQGGLPLTVSLTAAT